MAAFAAGLRGAADELQAAVRSREALARPRSRLWHRAWLAYIRRRTRAARALAPWCRRVGHAGRGAVEDVAGECKAEVLQDTQIFLATIASTSRLLRDWEEHVGEELTIHTVIVDECGCTTESSVALLARLNPQNLLLVGDHKQLPPTSMVPPRELEGTRHDRSLLERCVMASGAVHKLREQYRMHPQICECISSLFYNAMLTTPREVADARKKFQAGARTDPLVWCTVRGNETIPPQSKSYVNWEEVEVASRVAARLRELHPPPATIAVLTFYKGQLSELMKAVPAALGVEVLTVDSCQGSEFDHVVLSTVRANRQGKIGFVKDKQRINVACSRSLHTLCVVGCDATLSSDQDWLEVRRRCKVRVPDELRPQRAVPAGGASVYDALLALKNEKKLAALEAEADPVALMQSQASFSRARDGARGGAGPVRGATVIGGGGAKAAAVRGAGGGRGDRLGGGGRGGREWQDGGGARMQHAAQGPAPDIFSDAAFPDLAAGAALAASAPRPRACRAHGIFGCSACMVEHPNTLPPAGCTGAFRRDAGVGAGSGAGAGPARAGARAGGARGQQRSRLDVGAASRFIAHGIGARPPPARGAGGGERLEAGGRGAGDDAEMAPRAFWGREDAGGWGSGGAGAGADAGGWDRATALAKKTAMLAGAGQAPVWGAAGGGARLHMCGDCGVEGDGLEVLADPPPPYKSDTPRPCPRTNRTRRVPSRRTRTTPDPSTASTAGARGRAAAHPRRGRRAGAGAGGGRRSGA